MIGSGLFIIASLGGGVVVGGAFAAFLTLIQLVPRLLQVTETSVYVKTLQNVIMVGALIFTGIYFSDISLSCSAPVVIMVGLIFGIFIGLFSSALAEVLNVIPVLSKKLKIKRNLKFIIYSLLAGKVLGSIYYWTIF